MGVIDACCSCCKGATGVHKMRWLELQHWHEHPAVELLNQPDCTREQSITTTHVLYLHATYLPPNHKPPPPFPLLVTPTCVRAAWYAANSASDPTTRRRCAITSSPSATKLHNHDHYQNLTSCTPHMSIHNNKSPSLCAHTRTCPTP